MISKSVREQQLQMIDQDLACIVCLDLEPAAYGHCMTVLHELSMGFGRCIARHAFILRPDLRGDWPHEVLR